MLHHVGYCTKAPTGVDEVYTDSAFFFDRSTAKSLLQFYTANKPLQCEVDAYGDFLQASYFSLATDK
jgi:fucose-1-phosphate guanylyltransferase